MHERIRNLPRWVAIVVWSIGFALVLIGELLAVGTATTGDTISEITWFILGVDQPMNPLFLLARIFMFGLLGWLGFHFATRGRV